MLLCSQPLARLARQLPAHAIDLHPAPAVAPQNDAQAHAASGNAWPIALAEVRATFHPASEERWLPAHGSERSARRHTHTEAIQTKPRAAVLAQHLANPGTSNRAHPLSAPLSACSPPAAPRATGLGQQAARLRLTRQPVSSTTAQYPGNLNSSASETMCIPVFEVVCQL